MRLSTSRRLPTPLLILSLLAFMAPGYWLRPAGAAHAQATSRVQVAYQNLALPNGDTATVFSNGIAEIFSKDKRRMQFRQVPSSPSFGASDSATQLPDRGDLIADLSHAAPTAYAPNQLNVVFSGSAVPTQDTFSVSPDTLVHLRNGKTSTPNYTRDAATNSLLASLGVDRVDRLFGQFQRSQLQSMHAQTQARVSVPVLDFSNAYHLHFTSASMSSALAALQASPDVAYVAPDWTVAPMHAPPVSLQHGDGIASVHASSTFGATGAPQVPSNFDLASSAQSFLNRPSDDAVPAFDELQRLYHQLPGQGEIVTNVSLGDLTDASAASDPSDPCYGFTSALGPTTQIINGQRYINWPSMPLIPTYTADANASLNGTGEVCGVDPFLYEVGLDFSMMAPLPDAQQRPGYTGAGQSDLLGLAPGASYRLVVPASFTPTNSDVAAAFLAAGQQTPRPDVITASLGFSVDQFGLPSRYLEDDPLFRAIVTALVQNEGIVVSIAGGDGLRLFTNAAIGPSGGSAATNVTGPNGTPTDLNDIFLSTMPSQDPDSGAIAAGGSTLDDIFAAPPQDPANAALAAQHAFPQTRWTGGMNFSSAFGTRMDVSAPSDNLLSFSHAFGSDPSGVSIVLEGGTSASAPQAAAAAAVALQVARLTNDKSLHGPVDVRSLLESTGTPLPRTSQTDVNTNVGPQIDLGRLVETILARSGQNVAPGVARVAIERRRVFYGSVGADFETDTDPANITLRGPFLNGENTGLRAKAWITIAPDWEGMTNGMTYRLSLAGNSSVVLATTPWTRLLPEQILHAADYPLASTTSRTVTLTYAALNGTQVVAHTTFPLTFGPADPLSEQVHAPIVPATVTGATIPVQYDLTGAADVSNPTLVVSDPGRFTPQWCVCAFHARYTMPLTAVKGTVQVPVSALEGGGIYGIAIRVGNSPFGYPFYSDFAFTRVASSTAARPDAPLLSINGSTPAHFLEIPNNGSFQLSWNVTGVPNANGAMLEVSQAGPNTRGNYNTFNNPNGSERDNNGLDTASVYDAPLPGLHGTITLNGGNLNLVPTLNNMVRVVATHNGSPIGEAGEESMISMDGLAARDGGFVNNGYAINTGGNDGYLTSAQLTASGQLLSSVETFDQSTARVTGTLTTSNTTIPFAGGWGVYANDIGLLGTFDTTTGNSTYNLLNPVSTGTVGSAWTNPDPNLLEVAANSAGDTAGALAGQAGTGSTYRVFNTDLVGNTSGPEYDVSGPIASFLYPFYNWIAQNPATNTALIAGGDLFNFCASPVMDAVDLGTGGQTSVTGLGSGIAVGLGVDPATNTGFLLSDCDNGLESYNFGTGQASETTYPGFGNLYLAVDQQRGLVLMTQLEGADALVNNDSLSTVTVLREDGTVVKTIEKFNFFNAFLPFDSNSLQVNPGSHSGFIWGYLTQQLEPFSY